MLLIPEVNFLPHLLYFLSQVLPFFSWLSRFYKINEYNPAHAQRYFETLLLFPLT